jgi:nucleotide-binding universal stress UspA family protein
MKHIVVATDMSERSDRAIARALRLARETGGKCTVTSVVEDALPEDLATQLCESTHARLRAMLDAQDAPEADIRVLVGDIVPAVLSVALECEADLLVLGLHRQRAWMDAVRQTTMERILTLAPRPVLLVRDAAAGQYERALAAVNFSPACATAVKTARRIAPDATLVGMHALHIPFSGLTGGTDSPMANAVRREAAEQAEEWRGRYNLPIDMPEIVTGSFDEVLQRRLRDLQPQFLAIGAHTRSTLSFHKLGNYAAELIRNPPVDLLVAR